MKRLILIPAALLAFAARAGAPPAPHAFHVSLEPGMTHEECVHIDRGDKRSYYWRADAPVDFNVHYHRGDRPIYPLKRDGMRGDGGTFVAKVAQEYCWMWTARDRPVKLEGGIR
jgi:hypothetical protein